MLIDSQKFSEIFCGFTIVDCVVRSPHFFYFLAQEQNRPQGTMHLVTYSRPKGMDGMRWGKAIIKGWGSSCIGFSPSESKCVLASSSRKIFSIGGGSVGEEQEIPYDKERKTGCRGNLSKLKEIDGQLYVCGGNRNVGIRRGIDDWQWLTVDIPLSQEEQDGSSTEIGFNDIDGFSAQDLYTVGGRNDVWHFDGTKWQKLEFPRTESGFVTAVCCGKDNHVYIASRGTAFYYGRAGNWNTVSTKDPLLEVRDMVWFDDRLWLTGDHLGANVWWLEDGRIVEADIPQPFSRYGGSLSVRDGVLLLAGSRGAACLKQGQWYEIFNYYEMSKLSSEGTI